jgi:hypothetical protein
MTCYSPTPATEPTCGIYRGNQILFPREIFAGRSARWSDLRWGNRSFGPLSGPPRGTRCSCGPGRWHGMTWSLSPHSGWQVKVYGHP